MKRKWRSLKTTEPSVGFYVKHFGLSTCFIQESMAQEVECYLIELQNRKEEESALELKLYRAAGSCLSECLNVESI